MPIQVPPTAVNNNIITAAWGNNVRASVQEIDPATRATFEGAIPIVNTGVNGYDFRAPSFDAVAWGFVRNGQFRFFHALGAQQGAFGYSNGEKVGMGFATLMALGGSIPATNADSRWIFFTGATIGGNAGVKGPRVRLMEDPQLVFRGQITATSGRRAFVGWSSDITSFSGANNMAGFYVDNGNLHCHTRNGGVASNFNSGGLAGNLNLRIVSINNGGLILFFRDNILVHSTSSNVPTNTSSLIVTCGIETTVAANRDMSVHDLFGWTRVT